MARFRPTVTPLDDRVTPTTLPPGFTESVIASGVTNPTAFAVAPDGRLFVAEQGGDVRVIRNGTLLANPFVVLRVDSVGERGVIGVTLDPNFSSNGFVYVYYTVPATATTPAFNRVSRFTAVGDVAAAGSEVVLLNLDPLSSVTNHNGGALHFGTDGKLYIGVGDNANGSNSQSLTTRLGKLLRINPDGSIPADNPTSFSGISGTTAGVDRAVWAVGFRNPFSFAVQPGTGRIFIDDVGESTFEEIDEGAAGANYGWPTTEGDFDPARFPAFTRPVYSYGHGSGSTTLGSAITAGVFYNPAALSFPAEFTGTYFFTDLTGGWIDRLDPGTHQETNFATNLTGQFPVGLALDAAGDLLYLARGTGAGQGAVYRIRFTGGTVGPGSGFTSPGQAVVAAGAGAGGGPAVAVFDAAGGQQLARFFAFDSTFAGGVRVAVADVTGDRAPDVVAGAGPGGGPRVVVFDGAKGAAVQDFFAFEPTFTGGVYVAAADLDRDGFADLIVSADTGGGPRVRVVNGKTGATMADFFAFETTFTGGVRVAAGDVNGDGVPDLVVSAGVGGGPRVAVFDGKSVAAGSSTPGRLGADFFAFEPSLRNGAFVSAADLDGDGSADLITGAGPGGGPRVTAFGGQPFAAGKQSVLVDFFAGDAALRGGVTVAAVDADGDGRPDVLAAPVGGNGHVTAYRVVNNATTAVRDYPAFDGFPGAVFVG